MPLNREFVQGPRALVQGPRGYKGPGTLYKFNPAPNLLERHFLFLYKTIELIKVLV